MGVGHIVGLSIIYVDGALTVLFSANLLSKPTINCRNKQNTAGLKGCMMLTISVGSVLSGLLPTAKDS
jgi:hypothetical protein